MKTNQALVVLSGGQDSVTCLYTALRDYEKVSAITFDYGQRHKIEIECARRVCIITRVPHKIVNLNFLGDLVTSALVGDGEVGLPHQYKPGLPSSFVPNRNALLLTLAHAHAQEIEANIIVTGVCQTDYSGYPDCRDVFIKMLALALNIGYETNIEIKTPLMFKTKSEIFRLAADLHCLPVVLEHSHTCYNGDHTTRHDWGYGCNICPACELRRKGWETLQATEESLFA